MRTKRRASRRKVGKNIESGGKDKEGRQEGLRKIQTPWSIPNGAAVVGRMAH
jgi:hypothetical protein